MGPQYKEVNYKIEYCPREQLCVRIAVRIGDSSWARATNLVLQYGNSVLAYFALAMCVG
jgi:hypothetical protein